MTLSRTDTQHNNALYNAECNYSECHALLIIMMSVVMMSVIMMSVIILSVVAPLPPKTDSPWSNICMRCQESTQFYSQTFI
jgi:hypothetical protein